MQPARSSPPVAYSHYRVIPLFRLFPCSRYLEQVAQHTEEKLDKHRFLVQSRVIEDQDYNRIIALPASQRSDEVTKVSSVATLGVIVDSFAH